MKNNITNQFFIIFATLISSCSSYNYIFLSHQQHTAAPNKKNKSLTAQENSKTDQSTKDQNNSSQVILGSSKVNPRYNNMKKYYYLYGAEHLKLKNYYFDIPIVYNKKVKRWMDYFLKKGRPFFKKYSERSGRYAPIMGKILEQEGLPRDLIFLAMAESGFNNSAKSWAKAVGPWQFMPSTGKSYGLKINWYLDERRDPYKSTKAAASYLKKLYKQFHEWELAAAAYNSGEGKVARAIKRYRTKNFWKISRGRYLKRETKNYVPKIMALAIIGKNLESFGFKNIDFNEPLDYLTVTVNPNTDLIKLSNILNIDFSDLQYFNPEIRRWTTPPKTVYKLKIPREALPAWNKRCSTQEQLSSLIASDYIKYSIRSKRSSLRRVARKFKIKDIKILRELNKKISYHKSLKRKDIVILPFRKGQNIKSNMYADLYERPRRYVRRRKKYRRIIHTALRRGSRIRRPSSFYIVKKGDSLWTVARKHHMSINNLIVSNMRIIKNRQIQAGDRLVVR